MYVLSNFKINNNSYILCFQEEAENRKNEFWKLIDEHEEVIENIKKIELEHSGLCKISPTTVST